MTFVAMTLIAISSKFSISQLVNKRKSLETSLVAFGDTDADDIVVNLS